MTIAAKRVDSEVPERDRTTHVIFRALAPEDASAVSRLLQESPPEYMRFFHPFAFDFASVEQQLKRAKRDIFFGLEVAAAWERTLAGFYMLRGLDEGYPNPMYGVFVALPFRGNGLARLTLVHAVSFCKLNGYERILLKVDPRNIHAKKLYESCGFRFLREEPGSRDVVLCKTIESDFVAKYDT